MILELLLVILLPALSSLLSAIKKEFSIFHIASLFLSISFLFYATALFKN